MKLRLQKGDHYTYVITQESTVQNNTQEEPVLYQKIGLKMRQEVLERLGNGNYVMEASFLNFTLEIKSKGKVSRYDSDTINVRNKYYKSLNFLTYIKLNYEVSPEGVVSKLSGFEPITKNIETDSQLSGLLRSFSSEQFLLEFYHYLPLKNVGPGDKWTSQAILPDMMKLKYNIHYTFKEALAQNLKLQQKASLTYSSQIPMHEPGKTGTIKESGTQNGILSIDPKTCMCLSSDIDQQIEIIMPTLIKLNGDPSAPIKVITNTKRLLVKK